MGQTQSDSFSEGGGASPRDMDLGKPPGSERGIASTIKNNSKRPNNEQQSRKGNNQTSPTGCRYKRNLAATLRGGDGRLARETHAGSRPDGMMAEGGLNVRKLSNVSNRNIQLLSMKPRSECDSFAEGLRSRRRSSLISLILGAPSRGPRFSEDLYSVGNVGSGVGGLHFGAGRSGGFNYEQQLYNFGIDFCPDTVYYPVDESSSTSISSSLARLDDGCCSLRQQYHARRQSGAPRTKDDDFILVSRNATGEIQAHECPEGLGAKIHRRRSSLGSLTSFDPNLQQRQQRHSSPPAGQLATSKRHNPFTTSAPSNGADGDPPRQDPQLTGVGARESLVSKDLKGVNVDERDEQWKSINQLSTNQQPHQLECSAQEQTAQFKRKPSLAAIFLSSIDLTSSLDVGDGNEATSTRDIGADKQNTSTYRHGGFAFNRRPASKQTRPTKSDDASRAAFCSSKLSTTTEQTNGDAQPLADDMTNDGKLCHRAVSGSGARDRINHGARRMIHHAGSELSLYSTTTASSLSQGYQNSLPHCQKHRRCSRGSIGSVMQEAGGMGASWSVLDYPKKSSHPLARRIQARNNSNDQLQGQEAAGATTAANSAHLRETKLIIMLQVCLPFILAGFGNMGAGLVLNRIAQWEAFQRVPIFFVLLPSFVGLKGNIEMTLASRLSTLSNLNLLDTVHQCRHAFASNLILILSQAIGLSLFAALASVLCEISLGKLDSLALGDIIQLWALVVLPCALITSVTLVCVSSLVVWFAIWLAKQIQVNPDNLSTLVAALYGDVSCVLTYGLFAQLMYSIYQQNAILCPVTIISLALISWPLLWLAAYRSKETRELSVSSMPPMLAAIMVSLGSGAVLSLVVGKFSRIALYQPVVNGFGANLIAVQASRVSTWLWCTALRRLSNTPTGARQVAPLPAKVMEFQFEPTSKPAVPYGSIASLEPQDQNGETEEAKTARQDEQTSAMVRLKRVLRSACGIVRMMLWSFCNSSPNAVAARMLLVMLIPAHSLYFIVIWLLAPAHYVNLTWAFYAAYIALCLTQVFILLSICQPMMTLLMKRNLDPDIFGISLLMAMADLVGTLCLTGAFFMLDSMGDPNATLS